MLFLYFIALMIISLIERNIRQKMQEAETKDFALVTIFLPPDTKDSSSEEVIILSPEKNHLTHNVSV